MRAFIIQDPLVTVAEILAGGYDVLICSYEFFNSNGKNMHTHRHNVYEAANDQTGTKIRPKRTTAALHSELWKILKLPFKIAVCDEGQRINKRGKQVHDSLKKHLYAKGFAILSGTLPHNKWHNMSGYLDFGQNHPFPTNAKFLHAFASFSHSNQIERPSADKFALLQKFLQAITIARPASILNLPECIKNRVQFDLLDRELPLVDQFSYKYARMSGILSSLQNEGKGAADLDTSGVVAMAATAQISALHPMLAEEANKGQLRLELLKESDDFLEDLQDIEAELEGLERDEWLEAVKKRDNIVEESGRLSMLMKLYTWLRETYPDEKMVFFSSSLRFLNILDEAFMRMHGVLVLRYDGTVPYKKRGVIEKTFETCHPSRPLLITITSGKGFAVSATGFQAS
jgi:SNF2 family DNA or RNA helicase